MIDTAALLDAAKSRHAIPSDYKLALILDVQPSAIGHYRKGRSRPDDVMAQRLAEMAGLDPSVVIAEMHAERAQTPEARAIWQGIARRLAGATHAGMLLILSVVVSALACISGGGDAQAATLHSAAPANLQPGSVYYVKSLMRRVARALGRFLRFLTPTLVVTAIAI